MVVAKTGSMISTVKSMIERAASLQKDADVLYKKAQKLCEHEVHEVWDGVFTCYVCGLRRETKP